MTKLTAIEEEPVLSIESSPSWWTQRKSTGGHSRAEGSGMYCTSACPWAGAARFWRAACAAPKAAWRATRSSAGGQCRPVGRVMTLPQDEVVRLSGFIHGRCCTRCVVLVNSPPGHAPPYLRARRATAPRLGSGAGHAPAPRPTQRGHAPDLAGHVAARPGGPRAARTARHPPTGGVVGERERLLRLLRRRVCRRLPRDPVTLGRPRVGARSVARS